MVSLRKAFRFTDWSVRRKLIALVVAASLVPLAVATVLDIRAARVRLRTNAADLLAVHADHLQTELDVFHRAYGMSTTKLARLPVVVGLVSGRSAEDAHAATADRAVREIIAAHVASDLNLRAVSVLDRAGKVVLASDRRMEGRQLADRGYVRVALQGAPTISDIHVAEAVLDTVPVIAYLAPVFDDGAVVGLTVMWIRASALWDLVRGSNELVGPGSSAVVLDAHGIRLAHTSDNEVVFHPAGALEADERARMINARRFGSETTRFIDDVRAFPELFVRARAPALDGTLFRGASPIDDAWSYGVARRLGTVPWTVFYLLPERAFDEQVAVMTRDKAILAVVIMALAFAVGLGLAAVILRPVVSLSAATGVIASGDLSARVPIVGGDELGRLCASFNAMAERIERDDAALRQSRDELEERVAERTAELVSASLTEVRARAALEASSARLELLARTAHELAAASGDAKLVLELAARRLAEAIGGGCGIRLISDDGVWLEPADNFYHADPERLVIGREVIGTVRQRVGDGVGGRVAASGQAILIPMITSDRVNELLPAFRPLIDRLGPSSLLTLPLRSRERTIGVVSLLRDTPDQPYTLDDQRFAQEVADRAGLAIDNAVLVATLERRVAARTAALEGANHELEAFSYSVSHDLRAPLRAVAVFTQALLSEHATGLGDEGKRLLQNVNAGAAHMDRLITDLLRLSQLNRQPLHKTPVRFGDLAQRVIDAMTHERAGREIEFVIADFPTWQ
ncbi:MAG TPA: HAMP domain-containing protein, partial [Kofleriaceae bacterium]|nr:HAMP domain-containing protein [Kofleriaceae bacterium]